MATVVGLVSRRAELVVEVAALVAQAGAVVAVPGEEGWSLGSSWPAGGAAHRPGCPDLVVVDALTDGDLPRTSAGSAGPERRPPVVVVHRSQEGPQADARAEALAADHVVELPAGRAWLAEALRPGAAARPVLAVVGATGGSGTSSTAIALAAAAPEGALLVDLDPLSTGLLGLGLEDAPGARWPDLPETSGALDADSFLAALPRVGEVRVVCGPAPAPGVGRVSAVLATARTLRVPAVLDLGRRDEHRVLRSADVAVVVSASSVAGAVGTRRLLEELGVHRCVLAMREGGWVPRGQLLAELGDPPSVRVPTLRRAGELAECGQLLTGATGRALASVGAQLWELVR